MRKVPAALLGSLFLTPLFAATTVRTRAQSACTAPNAAKGEGKFTGQISTPPDGSSMEVTYGDQRVLVHYHSSVTVCQGGQPASLNALSRGASVAVFGPLRRNVKNMEMDAARIFVVGPQQAARPSPEPTQPNPREAQPRTTGQRSFPNSAILARGKYAATMQRLHVVRKYALADLRATPQGTLGEARLDFRPMLNNPKALFNLAPRLRALSQHVEVREDSSEISEVDQGMVIHYVLSYRIIPGKCSDPNAKAQLSRAGIECFTHAPMNERLAEFGKPGSPRYVADSGKRQVAIAAFQRNSAQAEADATRHIADLRKALADPTERAAIAAQVGQAETARMSSLNDDQLKEEMINSSVQRFEETLFVPKIESANYAYPQHVLKIAPSNEEMAAAEQLLREGVPEHGTGPANFPKLLKIVPARHLAPSTEPGGEKAVDVDMGPYFFLTGFTISHDYEWQWGAEVTINWCVVGCSSTYGIELYAGFNYAFGLRFLVQTQLKYHLVVHPDNSAEAKVTPTFQAIQGNIDEFFEAGLPGDQMFKAKELVAQVGANAGFSISLPGLNPDDHFYAGVDLIA
jgi:hypothetical protein